MATTDPVLVARNRLAGLHVGGNPDPDVISEARTQLASAHVQRAIQRALDAAPPITMAQRKQLAVLLLTGGAK